jgi:hypothetical protein
VDRKLEVYTDPAATGYRSRNDYVAGQNVPVVIDCVEIGRVAVADVLP